jgi:hypothetical protein
VFDFIADSSALVGVSHLFFRQVYNNGTTDLEDVAVGPASSIYNAIVRWNGTTGNSIQNSTVC